LEFDVADVRIRVLTPELAAAKYATLTAVAGLTKSAVGLGNVDNTADSTKPVSTAQKAYIDAADALKADAAATTTALAGKADASATTSALAGKADAAATASALALKADASAVYTKTQVDDKVAAGVGSSPIRLWDKTARTWPAVGNGSAPVVFMSTNDKTADVPAGMRVELDVWIPHVDATNA
jgi:hypothetical protein